MAKEHQTSAQPWGTLEELLLACAVNRHGTDSWDSIAMEVQNRTSTLCSLTSQLCRDKFNDLKQRFMPQNDTSASLVPMVDELRKIRVEELRREVHRRDVSIVSLELKVKRLEEERERSLNVETDLATEKKPSPEKVTGESAAGDDSSEERDNRSFNESNSTGQQKADTSAVREQNDIVNGEPGIKTEPEIKNENDRVRDGSDPKYWSRNGKLEEVDDDDKPPLDKKETEIKMSRTTGGLGESNELVESFGESKREEKDKQNSDVQSSASLSLKTKTRRRRSGSGSGNVLGVGSSSGEEPEGGDEVSPATKQTPAVKSESLVKLIGIIRSHRLGSVFERRLRSQESERYRKLIRQHMDLQTIQLRLDKRVYSSCIQKFFRDLLLLFNNAIIFFRKNSPENLAACELRAIVWKEMTEKLRKPEPQPIIVKPFKPVIPEPKQQPKPVSLSKPNRSSSTIVVCGKAKSLSENATKKVDSKKERVIEEKPKSSAKKNEASLVKIEDKSIKKKRTKDRTVSSNHKVSNTSNKNGEIKHQYGGNELSSHDALEMKVERKGSTTRKRQGAASFLKRMKQNSPSEVTEEDDDDDGDDNDGDDSSEEESKNVKGKEEKGRKGRNREPIIERITRSSRGRGAREESGRGKRNLGRPPKKQAESTVESGKRRRDNGCSEGGGRAKKRSRR
ncbi:hypothetical protein JCGZ_22668 [Jatropha curcas]|uniref:Bromo domain-containing protein n=1 Tax=Jatropha curcas TaxID=180498 RepID=A0A067JQL8_JATCU|nr:uncharacterized protein LOC105646228 [Jatropha curcas]KDP25133.1 hypothetical protein JCGZ_22668 [Jatropha curcas]